jgi:hypothetical protein
MKIFSLSATVFLGLMLTSAVQAKGPPTPSGICTDGSYSHAMSQQGACSRHGGVKTWYGGNQSTATVPVNAPLPARPNLPAARPLPPQASIPGVTGVCKDGSVSKAMMRMGACASHGGVQVWYGRNAASATTPVAVPSSSTPVSATPRSTSSTMPAQTRTGGGPGMVWVNTQSKVYHCSTDKWYGKTKRGEYMTQADASAKGFRPDHGKACL